MALHAAHDQVDGHAAATADLHHVAEALRTGRFADDAGVDRLATPGQPLQHLDGAVDRRTFLITGDQQADRTAEITAASGDETRGRGGEGRDRALHVGGAATEQVTARQLGGERADRPRRKVTHRHDVGMTGEAEMLPAGADARIEVGDVVGAGLGEIHALAREAERRQRFFQQLQGTGFARRHALAADERARQFDDIGSVGNERIGHGPDTTAPSLP